MLAEIFDVHIVLYCNVCKERSSRSTTGWLPKRPGGCNVTVILTRETPASRIWQEGRRPVFLEDSIKLLHQPIPKTCRQGHFFSSYAASRNAF